MSKPINCQLLLSTQRWLIPSTSTLPQNVWLLGPRIFPPLFAPSPTGRAVSATHFAANLTICLLARSPTATRPCTLNCCWRRTKKHCFPENTNNRLRQAVKKSATISPQQARQSKKCCFLCRNACWLSESLHPQVQVKSQTIVKRAFLFDANCGERG